MKKILFSQTIFGLFTSKKILLFSLIWPFCFYSEGIKEILDKNDSHISTNSLYIDACFAIVNNKNSSILNLQESLSSEGYYLNEWKHLTYQELSKNLSSQYCSQNVSPYLLAQVLSHLSIYNYCIKHNIQTALIVESDAWKVKSLDYVECLIEKVNCYDRNWDIIYTDVDYHNPNNGEIIAPNANNTHLNKRWIEHEFSRIYSRYRTTSFVISQKGMKKIFSYLNKGWLDLPYDQTIFKIPRLRIYGSNFDIITNKYHKKITHPLKHVTKENFVKQPNFELNSSFHIDPYTLLNSSRFDIIAKYIYAKYFLNNYQTTWHVDLYKSHIGKWNNFYEGSPLKIGFKRFQNSFHYLIDNLQTNGYLSSEEALPISSTGSVYNGSHRVGACLALQIQPIVKVIKSEGRLPPSFHSLRNSYHLEEKYLDHMAYEYAKLKKNTYIVCLFPSASNHAALAKKVMSKYGNIIFQKDLFLNEGGALELIRLIYLGESWVGSVANNFRQGRVKKNLCFPSHLLRTSPLRVYLFECDDKTLTIKMKKEFRSLCQIGNDSMHVNDTHEQTVIVAASLFNKNSIDFLNKKKRVNLPKFEKFFANLKKYLKENGIDRETVCVDASAILSAYGLRDCRDIDLLHHKPLPPSNDAIDSHNGCLKYHVRNLDDILFNPSNHFYYMGIKFLKLGLLKKMKLNRSEEKDIKDVALIDSL